MGRLGTGGPGNTDLTVQLDTAAGDASPFDAQGTIALTDLWVAGPDPGTLGFGAAGVVLTLDELTGREPGRAGGRDVRPTRIKFSQADVSAPFVFLLRTRDGWLVPPLASATEKPSDETPEIVLGKVRGTGGSLVVVDLVPDPVITWEVRRVDGAAQTLMLPAFTFNGLRLRGSHSTFGDLELAGSRRADTNEFEFSGKGVSLAAMTPYLDLAQLPYRFASGSGAFTARGLIEPARWSADVALTLQAPALIDPDASLQQAIGMPVSSALGRLRDQNGDVRMQVALASPRDGRDSYTNQVAAGVLESINRAAEEARVAAMERAAAAASVTVLFQPGQVEPTTSAMQQLDPLIQLLNTHTELVVALTSEASETDRRWLAEQALYEKLDDSGGFVVVLRAFGIRGDRERIRTALAARAGGAPGVLDQSAEALLTRLLAEAPPVDDGQLAALREARLARVASYLAGRHGIADTRIVVRTGDPREGAALSAVRAQLMIGAKPAVDMPAPSRGVADSIGSPVPAPGGNN